MSHLINRGLVDTTNSTTSTLAANGIFSGSWVDVSQFADICIIASASVSGTLFVDFSTDGTTLAKEIQLTKGTAGDFGIHSLSPAAKYYRTRIINGASAQVSISLVLIKTKQYLIKYKFQRSMHLMLP